MFTLFKSVAKAFSPITATVSEYLAKPTFSSIAAAFYDSGKPNLLQLREARKDKFSETDTTGIRRAAGVTLDRLLNPIDNSENKTLRGKIEETKRYLELAQERVAQINQIALSAYERTKNYAETLIAAQSYNEAGLSKGIAIERIKLEDVEDIVKIGRTDRKAELEESYRETVANNYIDLIERGLAKLYYDQEVTDKTLLTTTLNRLIGELKTKTGIELFEAKEGDVDEIIKRYQSRSLPSARPRLVSRATQVLTPQTA